MALTKVSYSMIQGECANILDFGAVGDGTTDDTTALENALAYCSTNELSLYVPNKTFKITSTITLPKYVNIVGMGSEISGFSYDGTGFLFERINDPVGDLQQIRTEYAHFFVEGNGTGADGAFYFELANLWTINNCRITNFTNSTNGAGVKMAQCYWWNIHHSHLYDIGRAPIWMLGPESGFISGCNMGLFGPMNKISCNNMTGAVGIECNGQDIQILNNDISGVFNADTAVNLTNCEGILIQGNYMEQWLDSTVKATNADYPSNRVEINNNMINSNATNILDFDLTGTGSANTNFVVTNNRFAEASGAQVCIYFGNTDPWNLNGNDPNFGILSDKSYNIEGGYTWLPKWVPAFQYTTTWDPSSVSAGASTFTEINLPYAGITTNDLVIAQLSTLGAANLMLTAHVRAAGVVRVVLFNADSTTVDVASGTLSLTIFKSDL